MFGAKLLVSPSVVFTERSVISHPEAAICAEIRFWFLSPFHAIRVAELAKCGPVRTLFGRRVFVSGAGAVVRRGQEIQSAILARACEKQYALLQHRRAFTCVGKSNFHSILLKDRATTETIGSRSRSRINDNTSFYSPVRLCYPVTPAIGK
jgi:hypothetical protein